MAWELRFLSICPRIAKDKGKLVASTAWRLRILTLGWLYREVTVSPKQRELTIYRRYFWFFTKSRKVKFKAIEAVTYGYADWSPESWTWAHDSFDVFNVGLRLHGDDDDMHLFYFYGDGTFTNDSPWPDWLYWEDYLFDTAGSQHRESRVFIDLLGKMIGVATVPARG